MNISKFSKGPWRITDGTRKFISSSDAEESVVAEVCRHECDREAIYANAHLIASAPEMYKMLEELLREVEDFRNRSGEGVTWEGDAKNLLAKARGEV